MRVGYSYWGLCCTFDQHRLEVLDTPDGNRYGRPVLVDALISKGHSVVALQEQRESVPYNNLVYDSAFPDIDVLFMEYRWPTHKNSGPTPKESDFTRQSALIAAYSGNVPVVLWDTDLKLDSVPPGCTVAEPCIRTVRTIRTDRVSLQFWSGPTLLPTVEPYPVYGYIGNNYERDFHKYYLDVDTRREGIQTSLYGNWLQTSPERKPPEELIRRNPSVAFGYRYDFHTSMRIMNRFLCTTHVSKPDYYWKGLLTPRYFEAAAVGCPAMFPYEMLPYTKWTVSTTYDVERMIKCYLGMSLDDRRNVVEEQRRYLEKYSVDTVIQYLESLC